MAHPQGPGSLLGGAHGLTPNQQASSGLLAGGTVNYWWNNSMKSRWRGGPMGPNGLLDVGEYENYEPDWNTGAVGQHTGPGLLGGQGWSGPAHRAAK